MTWVDGKGTIEADDVLVVTGTQDLNLFKDLALVYIIKLDVFCQG